MIIEEKNPSERLVDSHVKSFFIAVTDKIQEIGSFNPSCKCDSIKKWQLLPPVERHVPITDITGGL
jgi:hypothetical protein